MNDVITRYLGCWNETDPAARRTLITQGIGGSTEVTVFEDCAHAPIYENVEAFNQRTLEFLHHHPA